MQEKLEKLLQNSYSPYSKFPVAAIVVMKDGHEFGGVNVENASFGATICAERNAILQAVSAGYRKDSFHKLYVMCASDKVATPCFMCRQVISEFFEEEKEVVCMTKSGTSLNLSVKELCTHPFGEDNLK